MKEFEVNEYETRPVTVIATQFDGSSQNAWDIIQFFQDNDLRGFMSGNIIALQLNTELDIKTIQIGGWVVCEAGVLDVLSNEEFQARYTDKKNSSDG